MATPQRRRQWDTKRQKVEPSDARLLAMVVHVEALVMAQTAARSDARLLRLDRTAQGSEFRAQRRNLHHLRC